MKGKRLLIPLMGLMLVCCICVLLAGAAGSSDDPLISVSYLYQRFTEQLRKTLGSELTARLEETEQQLDSRLDQISLPTHIDGYFAPQFTWLDLEDGEVVELSPYASLILMQGEGKLMVLEGEVLDLNTGASVEDGSMLVGRHRYFAAEASTARVRIYGAGSSGVVDGVYNTDKNSVLPTEERFLDVTDRYWAAPYIWQLYEMGVVNGVEAYRFAPKALVTRSAFVTILGRLAGVDTALYTGSSFSDVRPETWYGPYVAWAAEQGITQGFGDGSFRPDDSITREQLAVMMQRYIRARGLDLQGEECPAFSDEDAVSAWALEAVNDMRDAGLMNGRGEDRFDPKGTATRAEICAVVCRMADLAGTQV